MDGWLHRGPPCVRCLSQASNAGVCLRPLPPIAVSTCRDAGCRSVAPTVCHCTLVSNCKGNLRWSLSARPAGKVSNSHVLLALRHRSRSLVMAHTQREGTDRMGELRGQRHCVASQPCTALAPRGVATCDGMGCAGSWADRPVLHSGQHPCIPHRRIRGQRRVLTARLQASWPTGAWHSCGGGPPRARPSPDASWRPWRSISTACAPSAGHNGPVHRLPSHTVGSAHAADRQRVSHGNDPGLTARDEQT
jgi:hypothetical protein